ncbi:hypothetical protein AAH994_00865 [Weeksellaceae bacterium A-14]
MKGILKIYHPEETLKYNIKSTYCKPVYSNKKHFLEVEIITDDALDDVDDDSLKYHFPQLSLNIFDFPIDSPDLDGQKLTINDNDDETFTEVNLFDDDEAFIYDNELSFDRDENHDLQLFWNGKIDDFYTGTAEPVVFRLKCNFKPDDIEVEDE